MRYGKRRMDVCRLSCIVALLAMGAGTARAADEILVLGDSWGFATAPALQQVLDDNGHASVAVVNEVRRACWPSATTSAPTRARCSST